MKADGNVFREAHGIEGKTLGVFFGSRRGELKRHGPVLRQVMEQVRGVEFIVPTLAHLKAEIANLTSGLSVPVHITDRPTEKWNAFAACDAAVAVSGTVGLELATVGVPHLIAYRMNALTHQVVKRLVKVSHAHLANIILGR